MGYTEDTMRKKLVIIPDEWTCSLGSCPPGFFVFEEELCFKTEYGHCEVYCKSGETFWGGTNTSKNRDKLIVQPVIVRWEEEEEE